jgi:hypothetical protein
MLNVTWTDLDLLAVILHFCNWFCIAARLICSFCEAMATIAVSSAMLLW